MWLDLPFAQVSRSVEQNVCTAFSLPNPLLESEELQSWGCSKILLSFLMRFDGHFWPNQQQQQCLPQFESIFDGEPSRHQLPSVSKSRIPCKNVWSVQSLTPISVCTNTSVSVADRPALKQNFMVTLCSFPPSMTYKENWLYKTSYNLCTVKDKLTKLGVWTDFR